MSETEKTAVFTFKSFNCKTVIAHEPECTFIISSKLLTELIETLFTFFISINHEHWVLVLLISLLLISLLLISLLLLLFVKYS